MKFNELDDAAKQEALDSVRYFLVEDNDWHDYILEDAQICFAILGITVDQSEINYSGFYSQGDGASFTGEFELPLDCDPVAAIKRHAPTEDRLLATAKRLAALSVKVRLFFTEPIDVRIHRHGNRSYHSYTMDVTTECAEDDDEDRLPPIEAELKDLVRGLADWLYNNLRNEYEYLTSDEALTENILANDYDFDEFGCIL